ncbi:hypothetical protein ACROYT_G023612 [Oculina patagonica]
MAHERLGKDEILEKFIISAKYGTPNVFPYGARSTIVLSKVSCKNDYDSWSMVGIHRNQDYQIHAETKEMESQKKQIVISITFANFYRTFVYPGNDENRAEQNKKGLRLLRDNGVQLRLLCGEEEWTKFLNDEQLVRLNDSDREACFNKAFSDERKEREDYDKSHLEDILSASAASALADKMKSMQLTGTQ